MQLVPVTSTGGGDNAARGMIPSAPLLRRDEEPMEVDVPPEAEPRPLPFARLFGGGVVPALQRPCLSRGSNQRLSLAAGRDLTSKRLRRRLSGGWAASG